MHRRNNNDKLTQEEITFMKVLSGGGGGVRGIVAHENAKMAENGNDGSSRANEDSYDYGRYMNTNDGVHVTELQLTESILKVMRGITPEEAKRLAGLLYNNL